MRSATRYALAAFAFVLWSGSAAAQNDVTFQVNIKPYIETCQFKPATEKVVVRGTINDWSGDAFTLADADGDGTYTGTFPLAAGEIKYKFVSTGPLSFEDGTGDRVYTVAAGAQTIPVVTFADGAPMNSCVTKNYDLVFAVDLSIEQGRGGFNPATQRIGVTGELVNGWDNSNPVQLTLDSFTGLYSAVIQKTSAATATGFKFVIQNADGSIASWDSVNPAVTPDNSGGGDPNRILRLTGNETDTDGNGRVDFVYDNDNNPATPVRFRDADGSQFLSATATVTYTLDVRSAQYRLADTGALPPGDGSNPSTGNTAITGVFINGPAAGESRQDGGPGTGPADFVAWGDPLAAQTPRKLTDPDADGLYTLTLNYDVGARRDLVAKFSIGGADNEAGFQGDHRFSITPGQNNINLAFGCIRQADGTFADQTGSDNAFNAYDEYLLIRNNTNPPTCFVVRNGGVVGDSNFPVAVEGGAQISGLEIGAAYPNPVRGAGRIELRLERAMTVSARVYDVTGRQVATLLDGQQVGAGTTTVELGASRLAAGVYVLRVEADGQVASRRLTVTR